MELYPLKFNPVYKDYLWGGKRIADVFGRDLPANEVCAESWEVSAHPDGMSVVENGPLQGQTLGDLVAQHGADILGQAAANGDFPLLIKLIDAERNLSVQVHPHDDNAHLTGGEPKTEMWYILDSKPGTDLIAGLEQGVDRGQLRRALQSEGVEDLLHRVPIEAGDAVFMPGGRVHAICSGALILEVQQSSNTTYRLYDWGRTGVDGKARELHVEQALKVIRFDDEEVTKPQPVLRESADENRIWEILTSPYFEIERLELSHEQETPTNRQSFTVLFCEKGNARLSWAGGETDIGFGRSILIPSCIAEYTLTPSDSECRIIRIRTGIG